MHRLTNWTAKRSGPCMTIHGKDQDGDAVKLSGIYEIGTDQRGRIMAANGVGNALAELLPA